MFSYLNSAFGPNLRPSRPPCARASYVAQGLKHNFENVQGCFYKITAFCDFLEFLELFY
jgi:hypothetical protein